MAKEPAGLRRWRLAHRKHKRARKAYKTYKREMRVARRVRRRHYYGRKRRGGRKSKAVPLAVVLPVVGVTVAAWKDSGGALSGQGSFQNRLVATTTGYDMGSKTFAIDNAKAYWGGQIAGIIVHKVAAKTINKHIRKLTMGYVVL